MYKIVIGQFSVLYIINGPFMILIQTSLAVLTSTMHMYVLLFY